MAVPRRQSLFPTSNIESLGLTHLDISITQRKLNLNIAYLPPEVWSNVLSFVDDYSLWKSCRKVSQLFRAEAEREFMRQRLNAFYALW